MRGVKIGLQLKITLAFSAVFIVLALLFNFSSFQRIRSMLTEDNDRYLLARAASLLAKTEISPAIIPLPDKGNYIRVFYRTNGQYRVVFESPDLPQGIRMPVYPGVTDTLGMRVAYVRNTGNNAEDNPAELLLVTSAAPLNERIHSLLELLFVSSLGSVLIAGCVSYLLSGVLLRPLKRIIAKARTINTNRLKDMIPVRATRDELQELTETLNAMLVRIGDGIRQQQSFFASASHELKTPLAILRAELELNLGRPDLPLDTRALLESQLTEIRRLQGLVEDFLVVSQLKEGTLRLRSMSFDVSAAVLRTFNQLMGFLAARSLTPSIYFDPEADGFMAVGDEDKIAIVLLNLVENATKYATPGTAIDCRVMRPAPGRVIVVEIENVISEERVDTVSLGKPFHREDRLESGAGLGLWLCNEIMRLHKGGMEVSSAGHRFMVAVFIPCLNDR